jgi:hypothetical protein
MSGLPDTRTDSMDKFQSLSANRLLFDFASRLGSLEEYLYATSGWSFTFTKRAWEHFANQAI